VIARWLQPYACSGTAGCSHMHAVALLAASSKHVYATPAPLAYREVHATSPAQPSAAQRSPAQHEPPAHSATLPHSLASAGADAASLLPAPCSTCCLPHRLPCPGPGLQDENRILKEQVIKLSRAVARMQAEMRGGGSAAASAMAGLSPAAEGAAPADLDLMYACATAAL
jgi:hypothetical protein